MRFSFRLLPRVWILVPLVAFGFLAWANYERAQRVQNVSRTDSEDAVLDPHSPTGYSGGRRWLIVPEPNYRSYQWIAETQQMLAQHEGRVRHVGYENAPYGREVHSASLYRWWLALLARCDHALSGRPLGAAVERAALWADPLLQLLLLAGTTVFLARRLGSTPAALFALGGATLYPLAGGFLPGVPDDRGLFSLCALWSVLPLLAASMSSKGNATNTPHEVSRRTKRLFFVAGVAGGVGLWLSAASETPIVIGIALGGFLARWIAADRIAKQPWRVWALGGAITSLAGYLIEYFPDHLDFRLEVNHPLFALAWLGIGELLGQFESWRAGPKSPSTMSRAVRLALAVAAVVALPVGLKATGTRSLFAGDLLAGRLSFLPNGIVAENFWRWLVRDGVTFDAIATCLPLLLVIPAVWLLARHKRAINARVALAVSLIPVLFALPLAFRQLAWWSNVDALLLGLLVALGAALAPTFQTPRARWLSTVLIVVLFVPGIFRLLPLPARGNLAFTRFELEGLIERGLAHWLADHAGAEGAVILVPPDRTPSWCFHGGLRGIGTANWENSDGLQATVRIVTATTADEAQELIEQRGIKYLVLPSWDKDLDAFAQWTLRNPEDAFIMALHHWALPPWLRPVPYPLPVVAGFEGQTVVVLEVTHETNRAVALGRSAEYFVETQQMDLATATGELLQRYPSDLGALIALAQLDQARGNQPGFEKTMGAIVASLDSGFDRTLPWDRRVSLATVLALAQRNDLAREQVRTCLQKLDAARIRSLTTGSLYRLQVLAKAFDLPIADPALRELARKLLPAELRARL